MKSIGKAAIKTKADLSARLSSTRELLDRAVSDYNEVLQEAKEFAESIAEGIQEYIDGKSEKWQEGDAASAYSEWQSAWAEFSPEVFELEDEGFVDALERLPEELEG